MKKWSFLIFVLWGATVAAHAQLQPVNFMVGEFTFERPVDWKWIDTTLENEKARLLIVDPVSKQKAIVSFELVTIHPFAPFVEVWTDAYRGQIPEPRVQLKTNMINQCQVVTVDIFGTKIVNRQPETNQATHGVVIECKGQQIGARILSNKPTVDKLTPAFTRIVTMALKPEE